MFGWKTLAAAGASALAMFGIGGHADEAAQPAQPKAAPVVERFHVPQIPVSMPLTGSGKQIFLMKTLEPGEVNRIPGDLNIQTPQASVRTMKRTDANGKTSVMLVVKVL